MTLKHLALASLLGASSLLTAGCPAAPATSPANQPSDPAPAPVASHVSDTPKPPQPATPAQPAPVAADGTASLTAADNGKTLSLTTDAKMARITLDGNPTTGYQWSLVKVEGKSLRQNGDLAYIRANANLNVAGSGGAYVASFDVSEPGTTTITMEYKRAWETTTPAARNFTVTVVVTAPAQK